MKKRRVKELVEEVGFSVANKSGSVHTFVKNKTPEEIMLEDLATDHLNKLCSRCGSHIPMWGKCLCKQCLERCNLNRKAGDSEKS